MKIAVVLIGPKQGIVEVRRNIDDDVLSKEERNKRAYI